MGEKTTEKEYENGTKYKYCFDYYEKCDSTFAIKRCIKIREDNRCLKQLNSCKFRERDKKCCLLYKCEKNMHE